MSIPVSVFDYEDQKLKIWMVPLTTYDKLKLRKRHGQDIEIKITKEPYPKIEEINNKDLPDLTRKKLKFRIL